MAPEAASETTTTAVGGNETADGANDDLPVVEEVFRERPDGDEPLARGREIPPTVSPLMRPPFVMGFAVAFDDQPSFDEEIDSADVVDDDLHLEAQPQLSQDQAHEALCPRLTSRISETEDGTVARRQRCEHVANLGLAQHPLMEDAIDGRHGRPWVLASDGLGESIGNGDHTEARTVCSKRAPMERRAGPVDVSEGSRAVGR